MALKVLMMGGRRCGKTSALASLFYQMIHGSTNQFLTVADVTSFDQKQIGNSTEMETIDTLANKRLELEYFIRTSGSNTFLADASPTSNFWDYTLQIQIPGTNKRTEIIFRDSAGEFFDAGGRHYNETVEFIRDCDVFVVVIDTPYLMAGKDYENHAANVVDSIHTFITQIDSDKAKAKQVLFVPIKCEKWIQDGKVDELVAKIEETYAASINHLVATAKTEISIIPIQTAGDILFSELRESYILYNSLTGKKQKCSKTSNRLVTLNTGKQYRIQETDVLNEDLDAVFNGTSIPRPSAWYHLPISRKARYNPSNCEQLPLHIIRFMFNKMEAECLGGIWGILGNLLFGNITKNDMRNALSNLSANNLIKDNIEGIKIIKRCF